MIASLTHYAPWFVRSIGEIVLTLTQLGMLDILHTSPRMAGFRRANAGIDAPMFVDEKESTVVVGSR